MHYVAEGTDHEVGGAGEDRAVVVFPTEGACQERTAGPCSALHRLAHASVSFVWEPHDIRDGHSSGAARASGHDEREGAGVDVEARGREWEAVMKLMLLSGEYASRHLQQQEHLPPHLVDLLGQDDVYCYIR